MNTIIFKPSSIIDAEIFNTQIIEVEGLPFNWVSNKFEMETSDMFEQTLSEIYSLMKPFKIKGELFLEGAI